MVLYKRAKLAVLLYVYTTMGQRNTDIMQTLYDITHTQTPYESALLSRSEMTQCAGAINWVLALWVIQPIWLSLALACCPAFGPDVGLI